MGKTILMSYAKAKKNVLCSHLRKVVEVLEKTEKLEISSGIPHSECIMRCKLCGCSIVIPFTYKQGKSSRVVSAIWKGDVEYRFNRL